MKLVIFLLILLILLVAAGAYFGAFAKVEVKTSQMGGETIVYEELTGSYAQTSKATDRVYDALLKDEKIETYKGIGIYFDDPKKVEESRLRFQAGCILEGVSPEKIKELEKKYKVRTLPVGENASVEMPFKGMVSILIGLKRAYPALADYLKKNNIVSEYPSIEIYDVPNKKIIYRVQLR